MNNKQQSQAKNQSTSNLRVERKHGGENVEEIDQVTLVNDPTCTHDLWELDPTETDFIAYKCKNPQCGMIALYDKP